MKRSLSVLRQRSAFVLLSSISILLLLSARGSNAQNIEIEQHGPRNTIAVRTVGPKGRYLGFDVFADGQLVAPVRFSSVGAITAAGATISKDGGANSLTFDGLTGAALTGLNLENSSIVVRLEQGKFPIVKFALHIKSFDEMQWQATLGMQPFHFLTIGMWDATMWHHRGWLNATPKADLFPLLGDAHVGTPEISAFPYNREWSTTPPLSAHPLPVIGLWSPARRLYAAWDFQSARLTDNSERDIATGYCNFLTLPRKPIPGAKPKKLTQAQIDENDRNSRGRFVALVYPYGGKGYQQLVFPKAGDTIESHASLVFHTDLPATADPNRYLWQVWWSDEAIRSRLARVPAVDDLSWIPGGARMNELPAAPGGSILSGVEGPFQVPGSRLISGWAWHNESAVLAPYKSGNKARIAEIEKDAAEIIKYAKRFRADGEVCVYWEKPLVGRWTDAWGGPGVTTLHNSNGFAAARLLLDLYQATGKKEYLPYVEGAYNWAKHIAWTRNEFADVPSSPFAIGGTLTASFLMDYYFAFRNDRERHGRAVQAMDLASVFTYRYMVMWGSDSIRGDNLDSAFLWEPNSGRDWTGAACSNEVIWNLDTVVQTAVHTGDPILLWAIQGTMSRWPLLYQEVYRNSLTEYAPADFTEGYGLAPGNVYGYPGARAAYGFSGPLAMFEPVGEAVVRVVAGEKAALAFDRDGVHTSIRDYRCTAPGEFAVTFRSSRENFAATVTFPYVDLTGRPVYVVRNGVTKRKLESGKGVMRSPNALWSIQVTDLHDRDMLVVGEPKLSATEPLPSQPQLIVTSAPTPGNQFAPFRAVALPYNTQLDSSWDNLDSFAFLNRGLRWIEGVPFVLPPAQQRDAVIGAATTLEQPVRGPARVFALCEQGAVAAEFALRLDNGQEVANLKTVSALAGQAWPPIYTQRLRVVAFDVPEGKTAVGLDTPILRVLAMTALPQTPETALIAKGVAADLEVGTAEWEKLVTADRLVADLKGVAGRVLPNAVAIVPPDSGGSPVNGLLARSGMKQRMVAITPEQLADSAQFNVRKFPVAVYLDGEGYLQTVKSAGDAADNMVRYIHEGGTLVLLSGMPYPMYYGRTGDAEKPEPLLPRLGVPLFNSIETAPAEKLAIFKVTGQKELIDLPARFAYSEGDPRLRCIDIANLPKGTTYIPIYEVRGADGGRFGDAAALVRLPAEAGARPGRILYVSNVILRDPVNGPLVQRAVLRWLVQQVNPEP